MLLMPSKCEFKRKYVIKSWVIKPVPVSELVIDILTLGLFRLLWNFFAARAIKQITKSPEINQLEKHYFHLFHSMVQFAYIN